MEFTKTSRTVSLLIVGLGLAVSGYSQSFLTNGLIAYYPFNGNANDESGNGQNGVVSGAILTVDRFGNTNRAFYFDGNESHIDAYVTPLPISRSPRTMTAWFSTKRPTNVYNVVAMWGSAAAGTTIYDLIVRNSSLYFESGSGMDQLYSQSVVDGLWHCGALTYDGNNVKLFVDGILKASVAVILDTDFSDVFIGYCGFYTGQSFYGDIDDIRIYNRALSTNEVQQLYAYESQQPITSLRKAVSPSFSNLALGTNYQLQVSTDLKTWTNNGSPFTPTNTVMDYPQYFDVDNWNSLYFRVQTTP